MFQRTTALLAVLMLAACGGGSSPSTSMLPPDPVEQPQEDPPKDDTPEETEDETPEQPDVAEPETPQQPDMAEPENIERLPFPFAAWTCDPSVAHIPGACGGDGTASNHHAGISGLPSPSIEDMAHMPVYADTDGNDRRLFVGIDQGTAHVGNLNAVTSRGSNEIRFGQLSDGTDSQTLAAYLRDAIPGTVRRYSAPPEVRLIGSANESDLQHLKTAVQLVNASLPDGAKMTMGEPLPDFSLRSTVDANGIWFVSGRERANTIHVEFVPAGQFHSNAGATTWNQSDNAGGIENSYVQFNMGANAYPSSTGDRTSSRQALILLSHELMHALGMDTHASPSFPTILEGTADIHHAEQNGERQPMSLLYPIDREAMQVLYGRLGNGDSPTDLGNWSSASLHIHGNGEHAGFGVAYRNGYAEPYAYGYRQSPYTRLAEDATGGTATWNGTLVGITPNRSAVAGDASVQVNLTTLTGTADFTALETWGVNTAPGDAGTGSQWLDGDLGYTITVNGGTTPPGQAGHVSYTFRETGGDAGTLSGIFTGTAHEGAAGTLERSDLTAAFGATRE